MRYRVAAIRRLAARRSPPPVGRPAHLILLPSDPQQVLGSRGDQAMLLSVIAEFRRLHPAAKISLITAPDAAALSGSIPGVEALPIWGRRRLRGIGLAGLRGASHMAVIGADIMDGYYWPVTVLRIAMLCESARLQGLQVGVLGFSFNAAPHPACVAALAALHADIGLYGRDPLSVQRFAEHCGRAIPLVADVAFCLTPRSTAAVTEVAAWSAARRAEGRVVVGFNLHRMLLDVPGACDEATAVAVAAQGLARLIRERHAAVLLMPHDFRDGPNDYSMLAHCLALLPSALLAQVLLPATEFMADELKALVAHCDVVLTGRMHLAIAALGSGVPIAAASYQDKFEGCLAHFGLPASVILQPRQLGDADAVWYWLRDAVDTRAAMAAQIAVRLPQVLQLSQGNIRWMGKLPAPATATGSVAILCFTGDSGLTDYSVSLARALLPYAQPELITAASLTPRFATLGFKVRLAFRRSRHYLLDMPPLVLRLLRERPDCVLQQGPLKLPLLEAALAMLLRLAGIRTVLVVHDVLPHYPRVWSRWEYRWFYRGFERLVVHSLAARDAVAALGVQRPMLVVPHGVYDLFRLSGISRPQARAGLPGLAADDFVVLFFGHLEPRKGLAEFLAVARDMRDVAGVKFVVAGNGEMRQHGAACAALMAQAQRWPNVLLDQRRIPFEEVERYFAASDVVALPYREGTTSGVLKLAIAFGVPVLASRVGDFPEQVPAGAGVLFDAGEGLAERLRSALDSVRADPAPYRAAMQHAALACDWDSIARAYAHFIFDREPARAAIA
ncbi:MULTISPECIES: glycosyltransferase [unclassified Duganella]|uniref:glycosyltransferase n=1 Tax=unclassified Duganella TaxID=2636909 RepID=UPI0008898549|nr:MULTISPECIES: glycosyltransferase [unclassified Duganella]SDH36076.1 Polysaccharide pyruvyl transferase family protein WcaK [Duganella sp. OV458]SDK52462.1 Polysaccharide pyruvyl transferase family protein WcaK [Duganella sp. OV510]